MMNLTAWRAKDLAGQIFDYLLAHQAVNRFADQDGINALLCKRCKLLDMRWNIPVYLGFDAVLRGVEPNRC